MRSGTSFFNPAVFKKTVTRFWPLWGVYLAIWLAEMPLRGLMCIRPHELQGQGSLLADFASSSVPNMASNGALTLSLVFGALAAMAVFSHLYNPRSANLFGSLPVRREGLFVTQYLAGLSFLIVPNAVIFLLTLLVEAAGGFVNMPTLLFWLAASCGDCFLFYSMAVFCAMFTGHILALPAFYGILNGIAAGATVLVQMMCDAFYYGYYDTGVPEAVVWLTPVANLTQAVGFNAYMDMKTASWVVELSGWGTLGVYALAGLGLSVCAFFLYRARRLESAGDVVSVRVMRPVFKYGVALCAGLAFGVGTLMVTGGGELTLMAFILIWGVIGYFAAQMLLDKSFRVFHKWKGAVAVAAVFVLLFCVVGYDLTGYETRIPDPTSVDSVYVDTGTPVYLDDSGDYLSLDATDPEVIRLLTILHQEAVAQRDVGRQTQALQNGVSTRLSLIYTLKNGGTLSRRYGLVWLDPEGINQEGTAAWAMQQLYDNHELYWEAYGFAGLEKALAEGARLDSVMFDAPVADGDTVSTVGDVIGYGEDAEALLAAVKEDFFAGRIGVRRVDDEKHWHSGDSEASLYFRASDPELGDGAYRVEITLQDTASSTIAELRRLEGNLNSGELREALEAWLK